MSITPIPPPGPRPEDLLALGHVHRWHTKPAAREQTLADHSAKVALIALHLSHHLDLAADLTVEVLSWALVHDLPEAEHGDIPSPAKHWLDRHLERQRGMSYDEALASDWWRERHVDFLDTVRPSDLAQVVVKVADSIEAATWYWTYGLDRAVANDLVFEAFQAAREDLPEVEHLVADFMEAAGVPAHLVQEAHA